MCVCVCVYIYIYIYLLYYLPHFLFVSSCDSPQLLLENSFSSLTMIPRQTEQLHLTLKK